MKKDFFVSGMEKINSIVGLLLLMVFASWLVFTILASIVILTKRVKLGDHIAAIIWVTLLALCIILGAILFFNDCNNNKNEVEKDVKYNKENIDLIFKKIEQLEKENTEK